MSALLRVLLLLPLFLWLSACTQAGPEKIKLEGRTMGTTYHITYIDANKQHDSKQLHQRIDERLVEVNQVASTYLPDSELSRFNRLQSTEPVEASSMMQLLIKEAQALGELTQGYQDATVGPLVNLWGFGPTQQPEKMPTDSEIVQALSQVGYQKIQLHGNQLSKAVPGLYIDMSSYAKGYGVDAVSELLEEQGIHDFLVEIGGEIRTKGHSLHQKEWVIALEKPNSDPSQQGIQRLIQPKNNAMATSGDYRIFFEKNGQRFSHLIDPKTGRPITHRVVSATVIASTSMRSDGLATGFLVMGVEKALAIANAQNIALMLIEKTPEGDFKEHYSTAFHSFLEANNF